MRRFVQRSLALLIAATVGIGAADVARAQAFPLRYLGQQELAFGARFDGTTIGGLSNIDYDARTGGYLAISDDPANARFYTLSLALTPAAFTGVSVTGVTNLRAPTGGVYATGTIDPEAIRLTASGTILYASEGFAGTGVAPFVREATADGTYLRDLAVPTYYNPAGGSGIRNNLAFESLTLGENGASVLTATENALAQDGPAASGTTGSPSRILRFDAATGLATGEFVYQNDPVAVAPAPGAFAVNGLVELLSLGGTRYLAVERSFTVGAPGTGYTIRLYGIDTAAATNVLGQTTLAGIAYTPVSKTLLFDLGALGVPLDNIEGVTFGPRLSTGERSLILVADDNFTAGQRQQFLAFAVGEVPEPATWAMLVLGFGAAGASLRRRPAISLRGASTSAR